MMRSITMGIKMTAVEALGFNTMLTKRAKRNAPEKDDFGRRMVKRELNKYGSKILLDRDRLEAWAASGDERPRYFTVALRNTMCDGPEAAMEYLVVNGWARE